MKFSTSKTPALLLAAALCSTGQVSSALDSARLIVDLDKPGHPVPPTLHGLFFEDINYAGDGGLYAELVQNRSFEDRDPLLAWSEVARGGASGRLSVESEAPLNANNTHFLRIYVTRPGSQGFGAANTGFDGMVLRAGEDYLFSVYARRRAGDAAALRVVLEDGTGHRLASANIGGAGLAWEKHEAVLTSNASVTNARLVILAAEPGVVDVDMVSLFPRKTFKNRRNGLRADLAQALADLKPGFLRFPGGCVVEGKDWDNAYRWKETIGGVSERKQNWDLWQDDESPDYYQSYGLGFFEFFRFCEDIGAEPLPVINCGMACQARKGLPVPLDKLGPWIQDALDLVEFANGPAASPWGAKRAAMGHPEPFHLKFLAVGNEQWLQGYFDRYDLFAKALRAKYPDLKIIGTAGPAPDGPLWQFAWNKFKSGTIADAVDEHYYVPPRWLLENVNRYDSYDRTGPKIFVGEFAAHDGRARHNNLRAALAEAAYMTGLVKDSDEVLMASYAPLFGKAGHAQWKPDLIWFDNSSVALTPSYYVQAQFAQNRPDVTVPITVEQSTYDLPPSGGMIGVGSWNTQADYKDIRVTAPDGRVLFASDFSKGMDGWKTAGGRWTVVDGALRQAGSGTDVRAVAGDPSWTDYTLTLKARKISGEEGFLVLFQSPSIDDPAWWNLGGWNNTEHSLQGGAIAEQHVQGSIMTNRWYDIRIEIVGGAVKAWLDGRLIHQTIPKPVARFYACAGLDQRAHEIILQLVNPFPAPLDTAIKLNGLKKTGVKARVTTLARADAEAENPLHKPEVVHPRIGEFTGIAPQFTYRLEPNSLTTLRIPQK